MQFFRQSQTRARLNKKWIIPPLLFLLLSGCGTLLEQKWHDFNAYYNTFYNAKQHFSEGMAQNRRDAGINPNELIRIHPAPSSGGAESFRRAIEGSADILRHHYRSAYVEDAIELIGISYFHLQEYFAALEKFQELGSVTASPSVRQQATVWEGRVYLELELYGEGIRFMESRIDGETEWSPGRLAEARAVLAQMFSFQGHLLNSGQQLIQSLETLEGDALRSRAYFHYGQIMERIGNTTQASYAYGAIADMRPSRDLEFHAALKEVVILRMMGSYDEAADRLQAMESRFYENRPEVLFEMAAVTNLMGQADEALGMYHRVIHSSGMTSEAHLTARSYYGMAEIHRIRFRDYAMAAAYYDSAATIQTARAYLPAGWDAGEMARSYGEYATVRQEITRLDSLLTLGRLSPAEREQVLDEIREERLQALEEEVREEGVGEPVVMGPGQDLDADITTDMGRDGFMNVNNPALRDQASAAFRLRWEERPLADDWRRRQAIPAAAMFSDPEDEFPGLPADAEEIGNGGSATTLLMDLSEIPLERSRQDSVETLIYSHYYRLGNIYLINLDQPDSAVSYFERVVIEGPEDAPKAAALYALGDLYLEKGDHGQARRWATRLMNDYPASPLSVRIAERTGMSYTPPDIPVTDSIPVLPDTGRGAEEWIRIAGEETGAEASANLLLTKALEFIRAEREDPSYVARQQAWQQVEEQAAAFAGRPEGLEGERDSLEREQALPAGREMLTQEELREIYPYRGPGWDSARTLLWEVAGSWPDTDAAGRAALLVAELDRYPPLYRSNGHPEDSESDEMETGLSTCSEWGIEPQIMGGMEAFMSRVVYPDWTEGISLQGDLTYAVTVTPSGELRDYRQADRFSRTGIPQAIETAMDAYLVFEQMEVGPEVDLLECILHIRIEL